MGKDALESSSGGDAPKLVLDIEHDFLDRYQLCIKAVVKMLIGENRLNKWLAAGWLHVTVKFHTIFTFFSAPFCYSERNSTIYEPILFFDSFPNCRKGCIR